MPTPKLLALLEVFKVSRPRNPGFVRCGWPAGGKLSRLRTAWASLYTPACGLSLSLSQSMAPADYTEQFLLATREHMAPVMNKFFDAIGIQVTPEIKVCAVCVDARGAGLRGEHNTT